MNKCNKTLYVVSCDFSNLPKVQIKQYKLSFNSDTPLTTLARVAHEYVSDVILSSDEKYKLVIYDDKGNTVQPDFRSNIYDITECNMVFNEVNYLPF